MKSKYFNLIISGLLVSFLFTFCHPIQWDELDRVDPDCPTVISISPTGAPFGTEITVQGENFSPESKDQFVLRVGGDPVPILGILNENTLTFIVPKGLNNGKVEVTREGCTGEPIDHQVAFNYYYSVTATPIVFAGTRNDSECDNCLNGPRGLDIDKDGNLYIADFEHQVIQQVRPSKEMDVIAGQKNITGNEDNPFDGEGATFANPSDVAVDPVGNIYVVEEGNKSIRKINNASNWPVETTSSSTKGIIVNYSRPTGIAISDDNKIFVVEFLGHRLRMLDLTSNSASIITDNSGSTSCDLSFPTGVEYDRHGIAQENSIYVADNNKLVRAYDLIGSCIKIPDVPITPFNKPNDIALDSFGNVFVVDQGLRQVFAVYSDGTFLQLTDYDFISPYGIAFDEKNNSLFVSDNMLHVVIKFTIE